MQYTPNRSQCKLFWKRGTRCNYLFKIWGGLIIDRTWSNNGRELLGMLQLEIKHWMVEAFIRFLYSKSQNALLTPVAAAEIHTRSSAVRSPPVTAAIERKTYSSVFPTVSRVCLGQREAPRGGTGSSVSSSVCTRPVQF